jgi:hypothetical protein
MSKAKPKLVLSQVQTIPLNKLVASDANVRRVKNGVSIEDLAADIAHRGMLQNLNVRPVLDDDGAETGIFHVLAGGRRLMALQLLVQQKRIAKTADIPCNVKSADDPISACIPSTSSARSRISPTRGWGTTPSPRASARRPGLCNSACGWRRSHPSFSRCSPPTR